MSVSENNTIYNFDMNRLWTKKEVKATLFQSQGGYFLKESDEYGNPNGMKIILKNSKYSPYADDDRK